MIREQTPAELEANQAFLAKYHADPITRFDGAFWQCGLSPEITMPCKPNVPTHFDAARNSCGWKGPLSFTAIEWFNITGRGTIATITITPDLEPRDLVGKNVLIDGKTYNIRAVESGGTSKVLGLVVRPIS